RAARDDGGGARDADDRRVARGARPRGRALRPGPNARPHPRARAGARERDPRRGRPPDRGAHAPAAARRATRRDTLPHLAPGADARPARRRGAARGRLLGGRDRRAARGGRARGRAVNPVRRVWGIGSPRTLRAHWMLRELGLDYETRAIIPRSAQMDDPELL